MRDQRMIGAHEIADRQHPLAHRLVGRQWRERRSRIRQERLRHCGWSARIGNRDDKHDETELGHAASLADYSRLSSSFTLAASCGSEKGLGRNAKSSSPSADLKASFG